MLTKLFGGLAVLGGLIAAGIASTPANDTAPASCCTKAKAACCSEDCCKNCPDCDCEGTCCDDCANGCECPNKA